jgi:hypothetical protein
MFFFHNLLNILDVKIKIKISSYEYVTLICPRFIKIKMNIVQNLHPFYYNVHKTISNMQYPHKSRK